jgi:hypothetical protein
MNGRRFVLMALVVCAVMAVSAASASAAKVVKEATGVACGAVAETNGGNPEVTGDCAIAGASVGHMEFGAPFGVMMYCEIILEGFVDSTGKVVGNFVIPNEETGGCEVNSVAHECATMTERHVTGQIGAKTSDGPPKVWAVSGGFCLDAEAPVNFGQVECSITGTLIQVTHSDQRLKFGGGAPDGPHQACAGGVYSLSGTILVKVDAAHPAIEILD